MLLLFLAQVQAAWRSRGLSWPLWHARRRHDIITGGRLSALVGINLMVVVVLNVHSTTCAHNRGANLIFHDVIVSWVSPTGNDITGFDGRRLVRLLLRLRLVRMMWVLLLLVIVHVLGGRRVGLGVYAVGIRPASSASMTFNSRRNSTTTSGARPQTDWVIAGR